MYIVWRIRWRGDEWRVRWEDGAVRGDAAADAFRRYAVSNGPVVNIPVEVRLADPRATMQMMREFADVILDTETDISD